MQFNDNMLYLRRDRSTVSHKASSLQSAACQSSTENTTVVETSVKHKSPKAYSVAANQNQYINCGYSQQIAKGVGPCRTWKALVKQPRSKLCSNRVFAILILCCLVLAGRCNQAATQREDVNGEIGSMDSAGGDSAVKDADSSSGLQIRIDKLNEALALRRNASASDVAHTSIGLDLLFDAASIKYNASTGHITEYTLPYLRAAYTALGIVLQESPQMRNWRLGMELLTKAAKLGDSKAQYEVAVRMYLGVASPDSYSNNQHIVAEEPDITTATTYAYFSASANNTLSLIHMGFNHLIGYSVPKSCPTAVLYLYEPAKAVVISATNKSIEPISEVELSELSALMIQRRVKQGTLQYSKVAADKGNVKAQMIVGQSYCVGAPGFPQNYHMALKYLRRAATGGNEHAMTYIGHMYAAGLGTKQNYTEAYEWFSSASKAGSLAAKYALGLMYLYGMGVEKDEAKGLEKIQAAAVYYPPAYFQMGIKELLGTDSSAKVNWHKAYQWFQKSQAKSHLLGSYNAVMLDLNDFSGRPRAAACDYQKETLLGITQLGEPARELIKGQIYFKRKNYFASLICYSRAALSGVKVAATNAAYIIDQGYVKLGPYGARIALHFHHAAAQLGSYEDMLAIGEALQYGKGVAMHWQLAANVYSEIASSSNSEIAGQAHFNLATMYQKGMGKEQDFFLADRHLKQSLDRDSDASWPVSYARFYLLLHQYYLTSIHDRLHPVLHKFTHHLFPSSTTMQQPSDAASGRPTTKAGQVVVALLKGVAWCLDGVMQVLDVGIDRVSAWVAAHSKSGNTSFMDFVQYGVLLGALLFVLNRRRQVQGQVQGQGQGQRERGVQGERGQVAGGVVGGEGGHVAGTEGGVLVEDDEDSESEGGSEQGAGTSGNGGGQLGQGGEGREQQS